MKVSVARALNWFAVPFVQIVVLIMISAYVHYDVFLMIMFAMMIYFLFLSVKCGITVWAGRHPFRSDVHMYAILLFTLVESIIYAVGAMAALKFFIAGADPLLYWETGNWMFSINGAVLGAYIITYIILYIIPEVFLILAFMQRKRHNRKVGHVSHPELRERPRDNDKYTTRRKPKKREAGVVVGKEQRIARLRRA